MIQLDLSPSSEKTALKGKNLFAIESKFFPLEQIPI